MIYMFLSPTADLGENQLFWGQKYLQVKGQYPLKYVIYIRSHDLQLIYNCYFPDHVIIGGPCIRSLDVVSETDDFEEALSYRMPSIPNGLKIFAYTEKHLEKPFS